MYWLIFIIFNNQDCIFFFLIIILQPCPAQNTTDFREIQCSSFNEKLFNGQKYTWSAYYHGTYFYEYSIFFFLCYASYYFTVV